MLEPMSIMMTFSTAHRLCTLRLAVILQLYGYWLRVVLMLMQLTLYVSHGNR